MRDKGVSATSVADVMTAAGMTTGGFYKHFDSKEELAAAASTHRRTRPPSALGSPAASRSRT